MTNVLTTPKTGKFMWCGTEWFATEINGTIYLTRTCRGCWAVGDGYAGMWNSRPHQVTEQVTLEKVADRDARVVRLREAGEIEAADWLAERVGYWITERPGYFL